MQLRFVTTLLLVGAAFCADVDVTWRVSRCLATTYCGPGVASGWIYLAMLGSAYLAFELICLTLCVHGGAYDDIAGNPVGERTDAWSRD